MNGSQYVESLKARRPRVFYHGERLDRPYDHPAIAPHVRAAAVAYDLATNPAHADVMTAVSNLTGQRISRFTHLFWSVDDLVKKIAMLRLAGQETGACFQRCVGLDAINAIWSSTWDIDRAKGTTYHARFRAFLERLQREDLMSAGAMTDVKGDRALAPWQQADPDLYVRIVGRKPAGRGGLCRDLRGPRRYARPDGRLRPADERRAEKRRGDFRPRSAVRSRRGGEHSDLRGRLRP